MTRYRVQVEKITASYTTMEVEAASPEAARRLAAKVARDGETDIEFCDDRVQRIRGLSVEEQQG